MHIAHIHVAVLKVEVLVACSLARPACCQALSLCIMTEMPLLVSSKRLGVKASLQSVVLLHRQYMLLQGKHRLLFQQQSGVSQGRRYGGGLEDRVSISQKSSAISPCV